MKVPGRKKRVTKVITFMDTVSVFVLIAMSFISNAIFSIFSDEALDSLARSLLISLFWKSKML